MNNGIATAMRRATEATRTRQFGEATRIIQEALAGQSAGTPAMGAAEKPKASSRLRLPLGDVVRRLREGSAARPSGVRSAGAVRVPEPPPGARQETRAFTSSDGALGYRLYVPASASNGVRGLLVMLHGCTQTPDDFAVGTKMNALAEAHGLVIAYPHQTNAANAMACWNWFSPAHQARDGGEPALIAGLTRELAAEFNVPEGQVFAAGLSAGGAMAMVLGETHPELFAAVGVHSGLAYRSANDAMTAFAAMRGDAGPAAARTPRAGPRARVIVFHGSADQTVHPSNADRIVADAGAHLAMSVETVEDGRSAGGGAYRTTSLGDADGAVVVEHWRIDGAGHAWAGGDAGGTYTDPSGPDASAEMIRFFLERS